MCAKMDAKPLILDDDSCESASESRAKFAKFALVAVGIVVAFATFGYYCPFYWITGIPCPGCFMTRAFISTLHFDFATAASYHLLVFTMPGFVAAYGVAHYKRSARAKNIILGIFGVIMLLYWIYRMLYLYGDAPFIYNVHSLWGQIMHK
jgi:hypothetical protein